MLKELFKDIQKNKENYSISRNGDQFEQWFKNKLKSFGFSEIIQRSKTESSIKEIQNLEKINTNLSRKIFKDVKNKILSKDSMEIVNNPYDNIKNTFIFQPYGSQNFPDFLIFISKHVIPIEIKYSQNDDGNKNINSARPMWNSNLPKHNAIYIYGIAGKQITFFKGSSILNWNTRKKLLEFFEKLNNGEKEMNAELTNLKNNFGLYPYIRKAYQHKKEKSTFSNVEGKQNVESYFSEKAIERENEVISFFGKLNNNKKEREDD